MNTFFRYGTIFFIIMTLLQIQVCVGNMAAKKKQSELNRIIKESEEMGRKRDKN